MGFSHETLFFLTACLVLSAVHLPLFLSAQDNGTSASLTDFALPEYRKDNRLQFILYGDKATNLGAFIHLEEPKVDLVHENITNINEVTSLAEVKLYPLYTPSADVVKFWSDKKHCRALIASSAAQYDKNTKVLRGDAPAFFRSREIDIDGVGFDADYENKLIHIRSRVRMVIRPEYRQKSGISTAKNNQTTKEETK